MYSHPNLNSFMMNSLPLGVINNERDNYESFLKRNFFLPNCYHNQIVFQNNNYNFGINVQNPVNSLVANSNLLNHGSCNEKTIIPANNNLYKKGEKSEGREEKELIKNLDPKLELTCTNLKARETMFDMENYNDYVEMEKKNIISQKIKASKKCYKCTFYGCNKKYSAPYNLKIHYRSHIGERPYKCNYPNCERAFYDQGNLKYHVRTNHKGEKKKYQFKCDHAECNLNFKTKKQKLNHHNKLEKECFSERNGLIKLAARFKNLYNAIIKEYKMKDLVEKSENHLSLKKEFEESLKRSYDYSFFVAKLGETFSNEEKDGSKLTL